MATFGAKGIAWTKLTDEGWQSPIAKFLSETEQKEIESIAGAEVGDVILFSADIAKIVYDALGNLRLYLAENWASSRKMNTPSFGLSTFR